MFSRYAFRVKALWMVCLPGLSSWNKPEANAYRGEVTFLHFPEGHCASPEPIQRGLSETNGLRRL